MQDPKVCTEQFKKAFDTCLEPSDVAFVFILSGPRGKQEFWLEAYSKIKSGTLEDLMAMHSVIGEALREYMQVEGLNKGTPLLECMNSDS